MNREEAVRNFLEANEIGDKARRTLEAILKTNPRSMFMVWETGAGLSFTSVPFSHMLSAGFIAGVSEFATQEQTLEEESDEEAN